MSKIFDFTSIEKIEATICRTWEELRSNLANKEFQYYNLDAAKKTTFLHVFDDLFSHGNYLLERRLEDVLDANHNIVRAAHIKDGDPVPTYERFIPNGKYITSPNRFSPPGKEWLYLAIGTDSNTELELSLAGKCALKECRASYGDHYSLCQFTLRDTYKMKKVIDLTVSKEYDYSEINNAFEQFGQQLSAEVIRSGIVKRTQAGDIKSAITKWTIYTYASLLSEQIFLPITTKDSDIVYAPFQCLAHYFLNHRYIGIVYSSTVFPQGKNIVLFDKQAAAPFGLIKDIDVYDVF